jgi:hypothetical protein
MMKFPTERQKRLRNLEIHFTAQQPRLPSFDGQLLVNLEDSVVNTKTLTLFREPVSTYAREQRQIPLIVDGALLRTNFIKMGFPTVGHGHGWFPFDSSRFDLGFTFDPSIPIEIVRITNLVPGFVLDRQSVVANRRADGSLRIALELRRNFFTQVLCVVFLVSALFFTPLILAMQTLSNLGSSVAAFFFSLWSFRGILNLTGQLQGFPTVLDWAIMLLCCFMLVGLIWRLATRPNVGEPRTGAG